MFVEAKSDTLSRFIETAKIQSTEASNKIEGIYTSDERLKRLVLNKTTPRSRNEQEIAGYRDVLSTIYESCDYMPVKPSIILQMHRDLYKFSGKSIGGAYKNSDNSIAEADESGNQTIRFRSIPTWETPGAIEDLCAAFNDVIRNEDVDPLLIIPMFILDFLCVHPFNDGNGRMSRLLMSLLLYRTDYTVGKYISIEKVIEASKDTFYEALQSSSTGWHENENDYSHFVRYMLGVILSAYRDLSSRVQMLSVSGISKPERIRKIIEETLGRITKAQLLEKCPDISQVTVQRTLNELVKNGDIIKISGGRYTSYTWNGEKEQ